LTKFSLKVRGSGVPVIMTHRVYKIHCNIDARKAFFTNHVVDIWNSLSAAVVFSHNVSTFKRYLTEFNFYRFLRYT